MRGLALLVVALAPVGCSVELESSPSLGMVSEPVLSGIEVDPSAASAPGWTKRIVDLGGCTGTLIDEQWVLTANHCIDAKEFRSVTHRPTNVTRKASHNYKHPSLDVALIRVSSPMATGYSANVPLYASSSSNLVGKPVTAYGFGWEAVAWDFGRNCVSDSDCSSGFSCSPAWRWCRKPSTVLRAADFVIDSVIDSNTRFVLRRNELDQLTVPGDSGGPDFLSDGKLAGVNSMAAYNLSNSKHIAAPAFKSWLAGRMSCPVFDPTDFDTQMCTDECLGRVGEGDCESGQCEAGLTCRQYSNTTRAHGFPLSYDICVDPDCPAFSPRTATATAPPSGCQYAAGEGHCASNDDCGGSLVCRTGSGRAVHANALASLGICVNQPAPGCSQNVCSPTCPCDLAEGSCATDSDCRLGLVCGRDMGGYVGQSSTLDVCVTPEAARCTTVAHCSPSQECFNNQPPSAGICVSCGHIGEPACARIGPGCDAAFNPGCANRPACVEGQNVRGFCTRIPVNPARGCSTTDPGVTYMYANEGLYPGQYVLSCNGRYRVMLQADGNFVFADLQTNTALWHAQTYGNRVDVAVMQNDGNLVIYDIKGDAIWASATNNKPGLKLKLFDAGILKLYDPAWGTPWQKP